MTPRVPLADLEELDPHWGFVGVRWKGEPFTGIGFEETPRFITEYRYENGDGEGRCISTFRSGQFLEEFHLHRGEYVGESRECFENGQLKRFVRHARPRLERHERPPRGAGRRLATRESATRPFALSACSFASPVSKSSVSM
jgi:hypothetical protein